MADLLFLGFVIFVLLLIDFVWGLCIAAGKPTPSPFDRIADYSEEFDPELEMNWEVN